MGGVHALLLGFLAAKRLDIMATGLSSAAVAADGRRETPDMSGPIQVSGMRGKGAIVAVWVRIPYSSPLPS